jgi:serine phosphatase RsbU (regulator of sigma subunit)/CHASE3 domain sensor protein
VPASVSRRVTIAFLVSAILALIAGALGISFALRSVHASRSALNILLPASATANQLLAAVVDQETGERGFVITGEPAFLQPYDLGKSETPKLISSLQEELAGRQTDLSLLAQVELRYGAWMGSFALPQITDVQDGDTAAAVASEKTGAGKALFDQLRVSISALSDQIRLEQRTVTTNARTLQDDTLWLIVAMTVLVVMGSFFGWSLMRRWVIRPIRLLDSEVGLVAGGEVDHRVEASGPEEISSLGTNIELMRQRVRAQSDEIRQQSDEIRQQRAIAETLQHSLLPRVLPTPAEFDIAARYLPGAEGVDIGGDWFNLRIAGEGRSFFAVGDVSGRGVEAAALMALLRFAINAYAAEDPGPASVLVRLGRLVQIADQGRFATVLCGLYDSRSARITLASAGHLDPVLITDGRAHVIPTEVGPPIGLNYDRYVATTVPVLQGTTVLAYTDGLVERRGEAITTGIERLREVAAVPLQPEALIEHLLATLVPDGTDDDVVLLGLRWAR